MTKLVEGLTVTSKLTPEDIEDLKANCSVFDLDEDEENFRPSNTDRLSRSDMLFDPSRSFIPNLRSFMRSISGVGDRVKDGDEEGGIGRTSSGAGKRSSSFGNKLTYHLGVFVIFFYKL